MNFNKNVHFYQIEKYEDLRKSSPQKSMGGCASPRHAFLLAILSCCLYPHALRACVQPERCEREGEFCENVSSFDFGGYGAVS